MIARRNNWPRWPFSVRLGSALILALFLGVMPGWAQGSRANEFPVVNKITKSTHGDSRQAFSGKVQSLNMKRKILNVNTVDGGGTELFPISKETRVVTANGKKVEITDLTPGANVLIYYRQKSGRRHVREIVVLAAGPREAKKNSPPS